MSSLIIEPGFIQSKVDVPRSKSHANRALILGALKSQGVELLDVPESDDVKNLIHCLRQIGISIQGETKLSMSGSFPACETKEHLTLCVGEGGTTARFLAALLLLGKSHYTLELGGKLAQRPWEEFLRIARELGAQASLEGSKLHIKGPIEFKNDVVMDCSRTTQFASAFMMIADHFGHKALTINVDSSKSYLEVTQNLINHFKNHNSYKIPQDWSSASYPMVFGALKQRIHFSGLVFDPFQADAKLVDVLKELGALSMTPNEIEVFPYTISKDIQINASDCLDLVPSLAFLLSHIPGCHRLKSVQNLVYKESDRLAEVLRLLKTFGKKAHFDGSDLVIEGEASYKTPFTKLSVAPDHRIVMVASLFMRAHGGGEISPSKAVNKSYPKFFQLMNF